MRPEGYTIVGGTSQTIYVGGKAEDTEEKSACNAMEEECPTEGENSNSDTEPNE